MEVLALVRGEWRDLLEREGIEPEMAPDPSAVAADGYPPCPACGCTEAPVGPEGSAECSDCGLFLG